MSDSFEITLGSYGNVRQPTLEEMKRAHDPVSLDYADYYDRTQRAIMERYRPNGLTPGTKAFVCLNCHYTRELPLDAVLHAIPMCERCFGTMQAIDYVGAE